MSQQSKVWSFTINNPTPQDFVHSPGDGSPFQFLLYTQELGGTNGTPHIQGVAQMHSNVRLSTMKKYFPRAHLEPSQGVLVAALYCLKPDTLLTRPETLYQYGQPMLTQPCRRFLKNIIPTYNKTPDDYQDYNVIDMLCLPLSDWTINTFALHWHLTHKKYPAGTSYPWKGYIVRTF